VQRGVAPRIPRLPTRSVRTRTHVFCVICVPYVRVHRSRSRSRSPSGKHGRSARARGKRDGGGGPGGGPAPCSCTATKSLPTRCPADPLRSTCVLGACILTGPGTGSERGLAQLRRQQRLTLRVWATDAHGARARSIRKTAVSLLPALFGTRGPVGMPGAVVAGRPPARARQPEGVHRIHQGLTFRYRHRQASGFRGQRSGRPRARGDH
jgi:hypothetical protein